MLRIIETFNNLPQNIEVDPDANFQPGNVGSLRIKNSKSVMGICDGLHPYGILDDIKSNVIRCVPVPPTQTFIVPAEDIEFDANKKAIILSKAQKVELNHANIIAASFISDVPGTLKYLNGIFILPIGTICNYCLKPSINGSTINDAVRFSCKYAYNINKVDDTTLGSGRVTVWSKNMIAETDMYSIAHEYNKYMPLYVENGLLTTKRLDSQCKCIGIVLEGPTTNNPMMKFLLDIENKITVGDIDSYCSSTK
jgi:hypothetical protein